MYTLPPIFPFSTPIIAAILGIAFPLIMQAITTIDVNYGSKRLNGRFKREKNYILLYVALIIAIAVSVYNQLVVIPWKYDCCLFVNWIMANSSNLILLVSMLYLVYILFRVVWLQLLYQDFESLFDNIHSKVKDNYDDIDDILDFVEMGKYVLLRDDNDKSREFYQFLADYAQHKSEKSKSYKNKPFEYDDWFYNAILFVNHELLRTNQTPTSISTGAEFVYLLISQPAELEISDKTYKVVWRVLQQQLSYEKTEWVYDYWTAAYQYIWTTLKPIRYYSYQKSTDLERNEKSKREKQIRQFREFHMALCGYILYLGEYDLLNKISKYSQSTPYQFPLIPSSFVEIFDEFESVSQMGIGFTWEFQERYNFPDVKGIDAGDISMGWYMRYLTLLLFRLNSFEVKYITSINTPWGFPDISKDPPKINRMKQVAKHMLRLVEMWKLDENKEILTTLGWSSMNEPDPKDRLKEFINQLSSKYEESQRQLTRSKDKVKKLKLRSKEILEISAYIYKAILNKCSKVESKKIEDENDLLKDIINPSRIKVEKKDVFSDKSTTNHFNYHEIDAQIAGKDFLSDYSLSFFRNAKRRYTINSDDLLKSIDRLIGDNLNDYEIIAFGDYFYTFKNDKNSHLKLVEEDEIQNEYKYRPYIYKNKLIINALPSPQNSVMDSTVLIIKKNDLPCYENFEPDDEFIQKRKYEPVDDTNNDLNLFVSVIFEDFPEEFKHLENTDRCLVSLYYCVRLFWKKNADVTMLKLLTPFVDSGKGMDVDKLPRL